MFCFVVYKPRFCAYKCLFVISYDWTYDVIWMYVLLKRFDFGFDTSIYLSVISVLLKKVALLFQPWKGTHSNWKHAGLISSTKYLILQRLLVKFDTYVKESIRLLWHLYQGTIIGDRALSIVCHCCKRTNITFIDWNDFLVAIPLHGSLAEKNDVRQRK